MNSAALLFSSMLLVTLAMVAGYAYARYLRPELFIAAVVLANMVVVIGLGVFMWSRTV